MYIYTYSLIFFKMEKLKKQTLEVLRYSRTLGMAHAKTSSELFDGRIMEVEGKEAVNFSLCDYLGLSTDYRLREAAAKAAMDYGVYTAVSRSFIKLRILREAEEQMSELFGHPTLVVPRTTLGHMSVLPAVVASNDLMILDHQVHTSVKLAAQSVAVSGAGMMLVRHNQMDALEQLLIENRGKYRKIWYMADGIYSMYGDTLPAQELETLMERYEELYVFVDDAHGMSWTGENGKGFTLTNMKMNEKMILSTSLGKGFGSGGGAIVCYDEKIKDEIEILGAPIMFSSPASPPNLGAVLASARIHMSDEVYERQSVLSDRIEMVIERATELELPIISGYHTPIMYLASGQPHMTSQIGYRMLKHGYHFTGGVYPAVPYNNSGVRIVLSLHQKEEDIMPMLDLLKQEHSYVLEEHDMDLKKLLRPYKNIEFNI